jgi:hypothetical protein
MNEEDYKVQVTTSLRLETIRKLKEFNDISMSSLIREIVEEYLDSLPKDE